MATSDETLAEFTRGVIEAVQDMIDRVLTLSNDVAERVAETVQSAIPDDLIANARRKLSDQFPGSTHCAPPVTAAAPAKKAPAKKAPAKKAPAKKAPAKKAPAKKAPAKKAPAKKAPAKKAPAANG